MESRLGKLDDAARHLNEGLNAYRTSQDPVGEAMCCRDLGTVSARSGNPVDATSWFNAALKAIKGLDKPEIVMDIRGRLAMALRDQKRFDESRTLLRQCYQFWKIRKHPRWIALCERQLGTVEFLSGNRLVASTLLTSSLTTYQRIDDRSGIAECRAWIHRLESDRERVDSGLGSGSPK